MNRKIHLRNALELLTKMLNLMVYLNRLTLVFFCPDTPLINAYIEFIQMNV